MQSFFMIRSLTPPQAAGNALAFAVQLPRQTPGGFSGVFFFALGPLIPASQLDLPTVSSLFRIRRIKLKFRIVKPVYFV
jgi:hypothetical protein